jgi:putative hydrolase of the HAD superfamily
VPRLRAIFFDLDDTLYSTSEFSDRARKSSIAAMIEAGLGADPEYLMAELEEVVREFSSNYEHHYDKLLLRLPRRLYRGVNPAIIIAAGIAAYHDTKFRYLRPFEDAYEVLRALARSALIRGVITAGLEKKQAEKLVRMRLTPLLTPNAIFISDQLGVSKPNEKLYQRACSDLNLKPAETMYVGDNPLTDIDPPNRLGMYTVHVVRGGGRHEVEKGETEPDWRVNNFWELLDIVRDDIGIDIPLEAETDGEAGRDLGRPDRGVA